GSQVITWFCLCLVLHDTNYTEMPHDRRVNDSFAPPKHLVKTKLCKHFTKGYCRYQDQCAFAHETDELVYRPDLTKTKMCSRFLVEGGCSNNCSFAHSWEELRHVDRRGSAAASAHLAAMVSIDRAVESPIALGSRDELGSHAPEPLPLPDMPNPPLHWLGEKVPPQRWLPLEEPGAPWTYAAPRGAFGFSKSESLQDAWLDDFLVRRRCLPRRE
ncbi:unnamed protein product, partial [Effrenium voratum]